MEIKCEFTNTGNFDISQENDRLFETYYFAKHHTSDKLYIYRKLEEEESKEKNIEEMVKH